ncbi:MAG: ketol-acid reductoisomerase, partial [Candidatus Eiseniibacteriota bacterium]
MSEQPRVAVLGFGHQGGAQALNLRDSGWSVNVGARAGGASARRARELGLTVLEPAEALRGAPWAAILIADEALAGLWQDLRSAFEPNSTLVFAHGFNLLYGALDFPRLCDVVLVSPTGPGRVLRQAFERGARLPAYIAAHRDASGHALESAEAYANAVGCGPLWRTTVREETEVDLFGEQTVLCGGMNALVTAAFE